MTQTEAFAQLQAVFQGEYITVSHERAMRTGRAPANQYWLHAEKLEHGCVSSDRSWEHLVMIVKSGDPDCWPEVDQPMESEAA